MIHFINRLESWLVNKLGTKHPSISIKSLEIVGKFPGVDGELGILVGWIGGNLVNALEVSAELVGTQFLLHH